MAYIVYECLNCKATMTALRGQLRRCIKCKAGVAWLRPLNAKLFGDDGAARGAALAESEGESLTAAMRTPQGDVSAKAGRIERDSPLFFGKGEAPTLFQELPKLYKPAPLRKPKKRVQKKQTKRTPRPAATGTNQG